MNRTTANGRHYGRPTNAMQRRARKLLASGKSIDDVAASVRMSPRAVKRLAADVSNLHEAAFPSPPPQADSKPDVAPPAEPSPAGEPAAAVIAETFGPPPSEAGGAPPPPGAAADNFGDPLSRLEPLTLDELVGMGDLVVGTVDSSLAGLFGGPPAQGMTAGQRGFLKVFQKRISRAIEELCLMDKLGPKEVLLVTLAVLVVPRGIQRVSGYLRRKRDARGAVPGRAADGKDGGGAAVGEGAGEGS